MSQAIEHPSMQLAEVIKVELCPACYRITRVLKNGELASHYEYDTYGDAYWCEGSGLSAIDDDED